MSSDVLSQLRDIHLPPPPSWWPPAPGWYFVGFTSLVLFVLICWRMYQKHCLLRRKKIALLALHKLEIEHQNPEAALLTLIELSKLLRRIALTVWPEKSGRFARRSLVEVSGSNRKNPRVFERRWTCTGHRSVSIRSFRKSRCFVCSHPTLDKNGALTMFNFANIGYSVFFRYLSSSVSCSLQPKLRFPRR